MSVQNVIGHHYTSLGSSFDCGTHVKVDIDALEALRKRDVDQT